MLWFDPNPEKFLYILACQSIIDLWKCPGVLFSKIPLRLLYAERFKGIQPPDVAAIGSLLQPLEKGLFHPLLCDLLSFL